MPKLTPRAIAKTIRSKIIDDLKARAGLQEAYERCDPGVQETIEQHWENIIETEIGSLPLEY
jgi:hypothetical protein